MTWRTALPPSQSAVVLMLIVGYLSVVGCKTAYYETMENLGYEKRDILVSRVSEARDAQEAAKAQFASALDRFQAVTGFRGGQLEQQYRAFKEDYEASEERAEAVRARIEAVESVADDLFDEWQNELEAYSNQNLRAVSEQQLKDTARRYSQLIRAMNRAEAKMNPVLAAFRDQVLFLKHNLNAQAIASLRTDLANIESQVSSLIREMNISIAEAEAFVNAMDQT